MAIRNDFTIDWNVLPRIITVDAPSTSVSMQDLLDTLRFMEALPTSMDNAPIVDASGKELLDTGLNNGLTVSLLDARIGFEARTDWTLCKLSGGNLVAFDGEQVQLRKVTSSPINPTAFINIDRTLSASSTQISGGNNTCSSDVNIVKVNGVDVNNINDFKATSVGLNTEEHNKLMSLPDTCGLTQEEHDKLMAVATIRELIEALTVPTQLEPVYSQEGYVVDGYVGANAVTGEYVESGYVVSGYVEDGYTENSTVGVNFLDELATRVWTYITRELTAGGCTGGSNDDALIAEDLKPMFDANKVLIVEADQ